MSREIETNERQGIATMENKVGLITMKQLRVREKKLMVDDYKKMLAAVQEMN